MPYSPESHLISSIILNGNLPEAISRGITSDMFHVHPKEWAWIMEYVGKYHKTPTRVAFMATFRDWRLARVNDTPHFADEVRKEHVKHSMIGGMRDIADLIADGDLDTALKKLNGLTIGAAASVGVSKDDDIFQNYEDIWQDAESRHQRAAEGGIAGLPTGLQTIDEAVGGLNPGDLCIVAARLGEMKSWTMQAMAAKAVCDGKTVQFDSMEMSRSQVAYRMYALLSGSIGQTVFDNTELMQGKSDLVNFRQFVELLKDQMKGKLHLSDASRGQVSSLTVASQIERNRPDVVFLDYLGLMKREKDWQGMAVLTGELKQIAVEYNIPIVAAAQLNREGVGKEPPTAEAIALSDAIGQDADMIVTQKKMSKRVLKARLAKARHSDRADEMFWLHVDPARGVYRETSANRAAEIIDKDREDALDAQDKKRR